MSGSGRAGDRPAPPQSPGEWIVRARARFIDERNRPGRQYHGLEAEPRGPRMGERGSVYDLIAPDLRLSRLRSNNLGRVALKGRRDVSRTRPPLSPRAAPAINRPGWLGPS